MCVIFCLNIFYQNHFLFLPLPKFNLDKNYLHFCIWFLRVPKYLCCWIIFLKTRQKSICLPNLSKIVKLKRRIFSWKVFCLCVFSRIGESNNLNEVIIWAIVCSKLLFSWSEKDDWTRPKWTVTNLVVFLCQIVFSKILISKQNWNIQVILFYRSESISVSTTIRIQPFQKIFTIVFFMPTLHFKFFTSNKLYQILK